VRKDQAAADPRIKGRRGAELRGSNDREEEAMIIIFANGTTDVVHVAELWQLGQLYHEMERATARKPVLLEGPREGDPVEEWVQWDLRFRELIELAPECAKAWQMANAAVLADMQRKWPDAHAELLAYIADIPDIPF
jgi:hypothetical protein